MLCILPRKGVETNQLFKGKVNNVTRLKKKFFFKKAHFIYRVFVGRSEYTRVLGKNWNPSKMKKQYICCNFELTSSSMQNPSLLLLLESGIT